MAAKKRRPDAEAEQAQDFDELLIASGATRSTAAAASSLSRGAIHGIATGRRDPHVSTILRLAAALGVARDVVRAAIAETRRRAAAGMYE